VRKHYSWLFLVFLFVINLIQDTWAINNPTVSIYGAQEIGAGNQNWMIDQRSNGDVVIANEMGLLIFNGAQWQLYQSYHMNAIAVVGERIYTGGYMDMGYWTESSNGAFNYTSLVEENGQNLKTDEQFWKIVAWEKGVIFQSLDRLLYFNEETTEIKELSFENAISKLFITRDRVFFQDVAKNLYELEGLTPKLFFPAEQLPSSVIVNLFSTDYGIVLFTADQGFFKLKTSGFDPWKIEDPSVVQAGDFFSAIQLNNGYFALGSITRGLFLLDEQGNLVHHLDQHNSLGNNTVLDIFEDEWENLWLGLDNGVNVVHLSSPLREYIDKYGRIGTVYTSIIHKGYLYVGTNQGLFYKLYNSNEEYTIVKNTNGQVWTLCEIDGTLFCGHNLGTYVIENNVASRISYEMGTWKILPYPGNDNLLIQGNYNGMHLLQKTPKGWSYFKQLGDYDYSAKQFEVVDQDLYYYHSQLGLNRIKLSANGTSVSEPLKLYNSALVEPTSLVRIGDQLLFSTNDGIFGAKPGIDSLFRITIDGKTATHPLNETGRFSALSTTRVVFFQQNNLYFLSLEEDQILLENELFLDSEVFKPKADFENISQLDDNNYLLGMTNGYLVLDLSKIDLFNNEYLVEINSVVVNQTNQAGQVVELENDVGFPYNKNNFTFHFHTHHWVKYQPVVFQYKLEGDHLEWSEWTTKSTASFYKLKPGPYRFKVRAKVANQMSENEAVFSFWIDNPWYLSLYAITIYFILFVFGIFAVNYLYTTIYKKRQLQLVERAEKEMQYIRLKADQELIQEKNVRLRTEIEAKNKELAVTAMSIVKKNEFLIEIREHLKDVEPTTKFKPDLMIRSINREIENEESWEMLKNAFENVDKDFIQKLLSQHPALTPNDLKLCTYLRLNMSSKEIATLLNISVRSMETKRYRLRRKLGLSHETNLTEYILAI
jgi:DNA-binding CsgD family transcriptional regulator